MKEKLKHVEKRPAIFYCKLVRTGPLRIFSRIRGSLEPGNGKNLNRIDLGLGSWQPAPAARTSTH